MTTPAFPPKLNDRLTPPDAADYLGVKIQTLAKWRSEGKGPPYFKLGTRKIVYRQRDLDAWLEKHAQLTGNA